MGLVARGIRDRRRGDRVGRGGRLGRAGIPRLLRRGRAADGAAPRRRVARPRRRTPRRARPALVYAGLAVGVAIAMPIHGAFAAHGIPAAQDHLGVRARARCSRSPRTRSARSRSSCVALRSIRRRPLGNTLIVLGVAAAATGSGLTGLGAGGTALGIAVGAALLYAGFVVPAALRTAPSRCRTERSRPHTLLTAGRASTVPRTHGIAAPDGASLPRRHGPPGLRRASEITWGWFVLAAIHSRPRPAFSRSLRRDQRARAPAHTAAARAQQRHERSQQARGDRLLRRGDRALPAGDLALAAPDGRAR